MTETRKVGVATMYTREERERRKRIHKMRVRGERRRTTTTSHAYIPKGYV